MTEYDIDSILTMLKASNDKTVTMPMDMMIDIMTKVRDIEVKSEELTKVEEVFSNEHWLEKNSISSRAFVKKHDEGIISGDVLISSCELAALLKERRLNARKQEELNDKIKELTIVVSSYNRVSASRKMEEQLKVYDSYRKPVKVKIVTPGRY